MNSSEQNISETGLHTDSVKLDPDNILPTECREQFKDLLQEFDQVFSPDLQGYNGAVGPFEAVVNMGPVEPPQRKGRVPQYSRNKLVELQAKFDALEAQGVFKRPEDIGSRVPLPILSSKENFWRFPFSNSLRRGWTVQQATTISYAGRWFHPTYYRPVEIYHSIRLDECVPSDPTSRKSM